MATVPAMASVIALAPASSKAEAISLATGPVDMEDAATEEASPITPPGIEHPLLELGTRAPGTPGSAFGVVEPWTDPDDISQRSSTSTSIAEEDAVSEAATAMSAEEAATAMTAEDTAPATAMIAEDAAAATAMPAEDAAAVTAMSAEDAAVATAIPAEDVAAATAMPAEDALAVGVSAVSATVDTIEVEFELTLSALPAVGVGLLDGGGRVESVAEVGNLRGLTVGCSCDVGCICEDVTVCAA